jgi:hypothetical protein
LVRDGEVFGLDEIQGVGQGHVAVVVVVPEGFPVGGDVHQLRPIPIVGKGAHQPVGQIFTPMRRSSKATAWEMGPS